MNRMRATFTLVFVIICSCTLPGMVSGNDKKEPTTTEQDTPIYQYEGSVYTGEKKDGVPHGKGKLVNKKYHALYEGEWKNGKRDGEGKMIYPDGTIYIAIAKYIYDKGNRSNIHIFYIIGYFVFFITGILFIYLSIKYHQYAIVD
jgi:hypothetical protein